MAAKQQSSFRVELAARLLLLSKKAICGGVLGGLALASASGGQQPVLAQGSSPGHAFTNYTDPINEDDPSTWDDATLEAFADEVHANAISSTETLTVFYALSVAQRDVVTARMAELAGVDFSELKAEVAGNQAQLALGATGPSGLGPLFGEGTLGGPGVAYDVQVLPLSDMSQTDPNVHTSSYAWDPSCDRGDPDGDYRFFASPYASVDPPRMRWFTYNSLVTWALGYAYPGGISTYGYHSYEIYVCLGDNGTNLAGGPAQVVGALRMKFR